MVETPTTSAMCHSCGAAFDYEQIRIDGVSIFPKKWCDPCIVAETKKRIADQEKQSENRRESQWPEICPPLYRNTVQCRLKIPQVTLDKILHWKVNPLGIGLVGPSGTGKTRAIFRLLQQLHGEGYDVFATTAKQFEHWCHRMFDKEPAARESINKARTAKILFIDDIGKEKYTARVESEFYDLIEHRTSHLLPTFWTANATGAQLIAMMGADRGEPVVRRLREFSKVYTTGGENVKR